MILLSHTGYNNIKIVVTWKVLNVFFSVATVFDNTDTCV